MNNKVSRAHIHNNIIIAADIGKTWTIHKAYNQPSQFAKVGLSIPDMHKVNDTRKGDDRWNRPFTPNDIQLVSDGINAANKRANAAMALVPPPIIASTFDEPPGEREPLHHHISADNCGDHHNSIMTTVKSMSSSSSLSSLPSKVMCYKKDPKGITSGKRILTNKSGRINCQWTCCGAEEREPLHHRISPS